MPKPITRAVAATLSDAVRQRSITQEHLGELIGRSQPQVSKFLRGEVTLDVEELADICRVLELRASKVIEDAETLQGDTE